jgi:hypothetical protein
LAFAVPGQPVLHRHRETELLTVHRVPADPGDIRVARIGTGHRQVNVAGSQVLEQLVSACL